MIITRVDIIPVAIPLRTPMYMSGRCLTHAENLIIRIEDSIGHVGWGEAASAPRMTGDILPGMVAVAEHIFKPSVLNTSIIEYSKIMHQLNILAHNNTGVKCAFDIALLDLLAKNNQVSLDKVIGTRVRNTFEFISILGNQTHEQDLEEAKSLLETGVQFFKIKVGKSDIEDEIRHTYELRSIVGNTVKLCADANMGLTFEQAKRYCDAVQDAGLLFLEQPLLSDNLVDTAMLSLDSKVQICMDESVFGLKDISEIANLQAAHGANLKSIKLGGLMPLVAAATYCKDSNLSVNISAKVAESGIATAAMLHAASVVPSLNWGVSTTNQYLEFDIAVKDNSHGLGIAVDEHLLKQVSLTTK